MTKITKKLINDLMSLDYSGFYNSIFGLKLYKNLALEVFKNKVLPLTIGNEIIFDSDSPEVLNFLNEWSIKTKLFEKCQLIMGNLFWYGKAIAFLMKDSSGFTDLYVADYNIMSSVAKVNENEKLAVIYTNLNKSDTSSLTKITIKENIVKVELMGEKEIRAQDGSMRTELVPVSKPIAEELNTPYFPVKEFINEYLPFNGLNNNSYFSGLPIYWSSRLLLLDANHILEKKYRERSKNQTRTMGSLDPVFMEKIAKGEISTEELEDDLLIMSNQSAYTTGGGNNIATIQGNPVLDQYNQDFIFTSQAFYEGCGYNYSNFEGQTYTNKTQSIMNNDLDMTTSGLRQKTLKDGISQLINCVLSENGLESEKDGRAVYSIKFGKKSVMEQISQLEYAKAKLEMGLISRVNLLMELEDIPKSIAQEKIEEADQDTMNRAVLEQSLLEDSNSDSETQVEKEVA